MIDSRYFKYFILCWIIIVSAIGFSQNVNQKPDKIIIEGKTFFVHKVQKGEGFYGIAKRYGVSQKEIQDVNPKLSLGLNPGDIIYIPIISGRNSSVYEMQKSTRFVYHTIEKGQTLYFLSRKYNVSIDSIKRYNAEADKNLLVGTIFKIPVSTGIKGDGYVQEEFVYHTVQKKETLYGISKQYSVSIESILKSNPALRGGIIKVGSKLRIPKAEVTSDIAEKKSSKKDTVIQDNQYIYHKLQSGETLFALIRQYKVSKEQVLKANPDIDETQLPIGYMVRIPKNQKREDVSLLTKDKDFVFHNVRRKETLYAISKKYNVSISDIEKANPSQDLTNLRKGICLKIPTQDYLKRSASVVEIQAIDNGFKKDIISPDSIKLNCGDYVYNGELIKVAILLPFDLESTQQVNIVSKIVEGEETEIPREKPIVSSRSRSFVEFYEGALMALDSLRKQGVNIQLFTYDTAPDTNKVKQILQDPALKLVDLIIGPAYASNLPYVSEFSKNHHIKMVYPLSNRNQELAENPFLFQVNTPDTLLFSKYAEYIVNKYDTARVLVLQSATPNAEELNLCREIKNKLFQKYIPEGRIPDYKEVVFSVKDIQGIEALLVEDKQNVVIIPSPDEADVSKLVTTLHGVIESVPYEVKLIGFGSWLKYQTINPEEIHDLNTEILTSYALDYNSTSTNKFIKKYRQWYYTEPFAVSPYFIRPGKNVKYSKYGIWGHDVTYYFISALVKYGSKMEYCITNYKQPQIQFNFQFKRLENWGGYFNNGIYVMQYKPSLEIYRTKQQ
jgi:LysM repeat protein